MEQEASTFADRVLDFYEANTGWTSGAITMTSPWADAGRRAAMTEFYKTYFADNRKRTFLLGINPGRLTDTSSGVPYTDGFALENTCGIANSFSKSREMTATFFDKVVNAYGGAKAFYTDLYAGAVFPFEILMKGDYRNYYDPDVWPILKNALLDLLPKMSAFGCNGKVVLIGTGDNRRRFEEMNAELGLFDLAASLDHPRYIMQYKPNEVERYVEQYVDTLRQHS